MGTVRILSDSADSVGFCGFCGFCRILSDSADSVGFYEIGRARPGLAGGQAGGRSGGRPNPQNPLRPHLLRPHLTFPETLSAHPPILRMPAILTVLPNPAVPLALALPSSACLL